MTIAIPLWLAYLVTALVCGAAMWKGDWEERIAGAGVALTIAITVIGRDLSWPRVQLATMAGDIVMFAAYLFMSLRTTKWWPLAAAAFQLLAIMTHLAKMIDPLLHQWAYVTANVIWTYLGFAAIGTGTWNAWRARGRAYAGAA